MPLGTLSKDQIRKGQSYLAELESHLEGVEKHSEKLSSQKVVDLSNKFYTAIPHSFGRKQVIPLLDSLDLVRKNMHQISHALEHPQHYADTTTVVYSNESPLPEKYISQNWELIQSSLGLEQNDHLSSNLHSGAYSEEVQQGKKMKEEQMEKDQ